jgi:hypothetical protein
MVFGVCLSAFVENRLFDSSSSGGGSSRYTVVSDDEKLYAAAGNRFCAAHLI